MVEVVTAKSGKAYKIKKAGPAAQMRVRRVLSSVKGLADDEQYLGLCVVFDSIDSIDGVPVPKANTPEDLERIAARVEDDLDDLTSAIARMNGIGTDSAAEIETAKNLPSTPD